MSSLPSQLGSSLSPAMRAHLCASSSLLAQTRACGPLCSSPQVLIACPSSCVPLRPSVIITIKACAHWELILYWKQGSIFCVNSSAKPHNSPVRGIRWLLPLYRQGILLPKDTQLLCGGAGIGTQILGPQPTLLIATL